MPKKNDPRTQISIRVAPEVLADVDRISEHAGQSRAAVIERALRTFFSRPGEEVWQSLFPPPESPKLKS